MNHEHIIESLSDETLQDKQVSTREPVLLLSLH